MLAVEKEGRKTPLSGPFGDHRRDVFAGQRLGLDGQDREVELVLVADLLKDRLLGNERSCGTAAESLERVCAQLPAALRGTEQGECWVVRREFDSGTGRAGEVGHPRPDGRQAGSLDLGEEQPRLDRARELDAEVEHRRVTGECVDVDRELGGEVDRLVHQLGRHPVETVHTGTHTARHMKPWARWRTTRLTARTPRAVYANSRRCRAGDR